MQEWCTSRSRLAWLPHSAESFCDALSHRFARELTTRQFVLGAESFGAARIRILLNYILPNIGSIIAVSVTVQLSRSILTEATISFLGVGIQPPHATWGSMLSSAQSYLLIAPWLSLAPGMALSLVLLLIANTTLDHRQRR